jgi:putative redox protein
MKLECTWQEKMKFIARADGHLISMDAKSPIGDSSAMTPKQLLLAGICGCTAMDVVGLLKKHKQTLKSLEIHGECDMTEGSHPIIFKEVRLKFKATGAMDSSVLLESVQLSQSKYCGVSAMVSKAVPISYTVELNGTLVGSGRAAFD